MSRKTNQAGVDLIKFYEGLRLQAYQDIVGKWTVGYGHCGTDVTPGLQITESEATILLQSDLRRFEDGVNRILTGHPVGHNSFSALVSFAYNLGLGNLRDSTLIKFVNKGQMNKAADEFPKWCKAGGKDVPGLIARRRAERDLFLKADA